jgi:predicted nucleic acid-binding protein
LKQDKEIYILDTTALLAYIEDEEGAEFVESILGRAENDEVDVFIAFVSVTEVFYITLQERSEAVALERIRLIQSLMVGIVESDKEFNVRAGRLKAKNRISLADAYVAALSLERQGILVHKDPEFERLVPPIREYKLPYK